MQDHSLVEISLQGKKKTYRVHHCFRDLIKGCREDVLQFRAVDQGVGEVDESSVINWKHREGEREGGGREGEETVS